MRRLGHDEGRVLQPSPIEHVIILGMGMSAYDYVRNIYEGGAKGAKIWTIASAGLVYRGDLNWNMHTRKVIEESSVLGPSYIPRLEKVGPVVACEPFADNVLEYPLAEVVSELNETYFANSICYAIAFAMLCGVKRLELYGCDFNYSDVKVYEEGRCAVEYWLGRYRGGNAQNFVGAGPSTSLLNIATRMCSGLYGYGERQPQFEYIDGAISVTGFASPMSFDEIEKSVEGDMDLSN